jgi:hypothetical protein
MKIVKALTTLMNMDGFIALEILTLRATCVEMSVRVRKIIIKILSLSQRRRIRRNQQYTLPINIIRLIYARICNFHILFFQIQECIF